MVYLQLRRVLHAKNRAIAFAASSIGGLLVFHAGVLSQERPASPIHFSPRPIAFSLDSSETPQRHAPETMAEGWPSLTTTAMAGPTSSSPTVRTSTPSKRVRPGTGIASSTTTATVHSPT